MIWTIIKIIFCGICLVFIGYTYAMLKQASKWQRTLDALDIERVSPEFARGVLWAFDITMKNKVER